MSEENAKIALIEAAYEALAEGGLDRFLEHWTEDLDHRAIEGALDDRGPLHGREAMRAYVQDWMDTFDGLEMSPIELICGSGNTVAAVLRFGGRAKLSGVATDLHLRGCLLDPRRKDRARPRVRDLGAGPRSRRAGGVGDVRRQPRGG